MGIFKAAGEALGGVLADQWLEYFSCDSLPQTLLAAKGEKRTSGRSQNDGTDGVISAGSCIAVADGQCAIVVETGKVLDVYDTPGEHTFKSGRSGSVFSGGGLGSIVQQTVDRIGFGGDVPITQTVLYFNMKEIPGNPFAFTRILRIQNKEGDFSLDIPVRFAGAFSFRISDASAFYKYVCRNRQGSVLVSDVLPQLTEELASAAAAALAELCNEGLALTELAACTEDVCGAIAKRLTAKWEPLRGFTVVSCAVRELYVADADRSALQQLEIAKTLSDPALAAGYLAAAQADAMRSAAVNPAGVAGAALFAGRGNPSVPLAFLFSVGERTKATEPVAAPTRAVPEGAQPPETNMFLQNDPAAPRLWRCACGRFNTTPYCENCGRHFS